MTYGIIWVAVARVFDLLELRTWGKASLVWPCSLGWGRAWVFLLDFTFPYFLLKVNTILIFMMIWTVDLLLSVMHNS